MGLSLLALAVLAATPKAPSDSESALVVFTDTIERLPLPTAPAAIDVDVWKREVRLTVAKPALVAKALRGSRICPKVNVRDGRVVLHCRIGAVEARPGVGRSGPQLALSVPRGLPRDDRQSLGATWHYPPERFSLGGPCPGTTPEGRAECLLATGRPDDAVPLLREALQHGNADFAALRLGDIALAKGDVLGALASYQAAGRKDLYGRIALMRVCELAGCQREELVFDSARLPEPLGTEVDLRLARALALRGQEGRAALALHRRLMDRERPPVCPPWPQVCAGVALSALRHEDDQVQALGLEVFLGMQRELGLSSDPELLRAASDVAAHFGAPGFAANLLATATPHVLPSRLGEHLARVAFLYEAAGDSLRADVVRAYAKTRLSRPLNVKPPPPSRPDLRTDGLATKMDAVLDEAGAALELADALAVTSRSRASAVLGAAAVAMPVAVDSPPDAAPAARPPSPDAAPPPPRAHTPASEN